MTQITSTPGERPAPPPPGGPEGPLPGARAALVLLLLINLFNYIDRQVLAANLTPIEAQLLPKNDPANKEWLGNLAMAFMLSYMVFAPVFAWLAGRFHRWKLVGVGVILWSLASGASGLAGSFHAGAVGATGFHHFVGTFGFLLVTRCFVGVGEAAYGPVAPTVISDLYPVKVRGSVLAWFYAAIPVGSALGYTFGGLLGWPHAFYWVVPPGLLLGVWCFLMPEPPVGQADPGAELARPVRVRDYLVLARVPSYVLVTLGMAAMTFALGGIGYFMPDYIHTYKGVEDLARVNFVFGVIVVVAGLGATLLGGYVGDILRPRFPGSYFLVSAVAMFLGFPLFLAVIYAPFPWAWGLIFLACFCLFFNTGPTNTILANVTHPAVRAQAFAVNIFVIHLLGDAISPTIIGVIAREFRYPDGTPNMNAGFLAVSGMVLVGGALWLAGVPFLARDTARAPKQLDQR
jgi:MFS family permease